MNSKISITIGLVTIVLALLSLAWFSNVGSERVDQANENLEKERDNLDSFVDKAIIHCQNDGDECDVLMPQWLEECKKPELENLPSCNDGRIEQLIEKMTMISDECGELQKIMKQSQFSASSESKIAYEDAMNDYNSLGCP